MIRTFLEFHGVFDIAPAAKIRSAGDNVDEPSRSVLVRRGGDEEVGRWWGGPVEREPGIQGAASVRQLRRGEVVIDFQTEGEGRGCCGAPVVLIRG